MNTISVILAAGEGKRMKSSLSKVLHEVCGKSLLGHVLVAAEAVSDRQVVVIGHGKEEVRTAAGEKYDYVVQEEQLGTGHAVKMAREFLSIEEVLILCGDTPLISEEVLRALIAEHRKERSLGTVLTADIPFPTGYGRIIRGERGKVLRIVEEKDASKDERRIHEINTGTYCFHGPSLLTVLDSLSTDNKQGEYYLTDVMEILANQGETAACKLSDHRFSLGVNTKEQLSEAATVMRELKNKKLMLEGVTMPDPTTVYIDVDVEIGMDTVIYPNTIIEGKSKLGKGCKIGPNSHLTDALLGDNITLQHSVIVDSSVAKGSVIGPFAYIRPGTEIGPEVKIGDFVEVKNSKIGAGTKVPHLTYVGDAEIGPKANLGAGTIVVNYDGRVKHKTYIGEGSFIGCNSNLIAPLKIGERAFVAAGSTINNDVPSGSLALARPRQVIKQGLAKKFLKPKN